MAKFPFFHQLDSMDCGPCCLRMIAAWHGKSYSLQTMRTRSGISKEGVSLLGISEAAASVGFRTMALETTLEKLDEAGTGPFIVHWLKQHFVVVYKIDKDKVYIADPATGRMVYSRKEFVSRWTGMVNTPHGQGVVLLLEPAPSFYEALGEKTAVLNFTALLRYLSPYKKLLLQLLAGLLAGTAIQTIFPFLTQAVVDIGIDTKDIAFIYILLFAQLLLFTGQVSAEFIRSWILLHINTRINLAILEDFLIKLMKLPISFFESRMIGDIMQRIGDQQRIQTFLTGPALNTIFSMLNFLVFTVVIAVYNFTVFSVFIGGTIVYVGWVLLFLSYRKKIDYKKFDAMSRNQSSLVQLVLGMQEIKMNNCETAKRWEWKKIQASLFKVNARSLASTQYQQGGGFFINQAKNMVITFFSATAVIKGRLTLGEMLAIQYMIGQLNSPVEQFIQFAQSVQDARISMDRMNEIHRIPDEEPEGTVKLMEIPDHTGLSLKKVGFKYAGSGNDLVLKEIDAFIPAGRTTAIVGVSGSGKTTLLKLLMKFYDPVQGEICLGDTDLQDISNKVWRRHCGAVLQDSYIFSDTIGRNIALGEEESDIHKLWQAVRTANIHEFIKSLPRGFDTKIGSEGDGISQGQRQRILIARAVYKDPSFIFFDEATNALDANNEKIIQHNLDEFFKGRTVIVAAHRLSTIKKADQIIVMHHGRIIEQGHHRQLMEDQGAYFELVKDQLELQG